MNIVKKPTNSPTQGQPEPRENQVKRGVWAVFFPTANMFSWVGIGFLHRKQTTRSLTQPNSPRPPEQFISLK